MFPVIICTLIIVISFWIETHLIFFFKVNGSSCMYAIPKLYTYMLLATIIDCDHFEHKFSLNLLPLIISNLMKLQYLINLFIRIVCKIREKKIWIGIWDTLSWLFSISCYQTGFCLHNFLIWRNSISSRCRHLTWLNQAIFSKTKDLCYNYSK